MIEMTTSKCFFTAIMALLLAGSVSLAESAGGINDDFSTYPAGTRFDNSPHSNAGGWAWSAAHLTMNEGSMEVADGEGGQKLLKVELPFPSSGNGNWRLLCELEQPIEFGDNRPIKLQTALRIPDLDFPMDMVVGIASPHRNVPLALAAEDFQPIFRFIVSPASGLNQFRYVAKAGDGAGEEVNYLIATDFQVEKGEWYDVTVNFKPPQQTYDIEVRTDDGTTVFSAFDVAWVSEFPGMAGVAFKNRTTNDLRSAKFELRRVVLQSFQE